MIHAVYIKNTPKGVWHLMTIAKSAETAKEDKVFLLKDAIKTGNKEAEAAIKTYDTIWFVPETLKEIKEEDKLLYN